MAILNDEINTLLGTLVSKPDTITVLISLTGALMLATLMWLAYRLANTAATYQPKFAATLVSLALLSTILMNLIQSNLALSLGMLGSLSIVRFRTNIKDPRDIGFIFWSMAIGLSAATGCYFIGATGSLLLGAFMIATRKRGSTPDDMMLVVRGSSTDIGVINSLVTHSCLHNEVKAKNVLSDSFELVYEVRISEKSSNELIEELFLLGGIDSVNLLSETKAA